MHDRGTLASYILSPLSRITNPEHTSQFKLVKGHQSNPVNDLSKKKKIPVILYSNMLIFRDADKIFELQEDFLKMLKNKNYHVDLVVYEKRE